MIPNIIKIAINKFTFFRLPAHNLSIKACYPMSSEKGGKGPIVTTQKPYSIEFQTNKPKKPLGPLKQIKKKVEKPSQRIFAQVEQLKNRKQDIKKEQVSRICQSIMALPDTQRLSLIKYLMSVLFKKQYPKQQILNSKALQTLRAPYPYVELQSIMYVITKQLYSISQSNAQTKSPSPPSSQHFASTPMNPNRNEDFVNNLYLRCFNDVVAKIPDQDKEKIKCQALLCKNFGKYMAELGNIPKALEMIQRSIRKHQELIAEQFRKFQQLVKKLDQQQQIKSPAQKEQQKFQINALKQNIRRLIQSMLESLHYYYIMRKSEITPGAPTPKSLNTVLQLLSVFTSSLRMKSLMPGIQLYSRHYHRLAQIQCQLQYYYAMHTKNKQKIKQIQAKMRELYKQCMNDIQESLGLIQVQREIAAVAFSIRMHISRMEKKDKIGIKEDLAACGMDIIRLGKMEQKSPSKQIITKLLSAFIKKNIH